MVDPGGAAATGDRFDQTANRAEPCPPSEAEFNDASNTFAGPLDQMPALVDLISETAITEPSLLKEELGECEEQREAAHVLKDNVRSKETKQDKVGELLFANQAAIMIVSRSGYYGTLLWTLQDSHLFHPRNGYGSKRIRTELKRRSQLTRDSDDEWFTWAPLHPDNMTHLLGAIRGPAETPYSDGIFHIQIQLSPDYPIQPPGCWFLIKVYHPNVDAKGAICADLLEEGWRPVMTIGKLLISIFSILSEPSLFQKPRSGHSVDPPLSPQIAQQWKDDRMAFDCTVREWTKRYATGEVFLRQWRMVFQTLLVAYSQGCVCKLHLKL
jgi:ubiquitin-conjugating enzyme E2 D/E